MTYHHAPREAEAEALPELPFPLPSYYAGQSILIPVMYPLEYETDAAEVLRVSEGLALAEGAADDAAIRWSARS